MGEHEQRERLSLRGRMAAFGVALVSLAAIAVAALLVLPFGVFDGEEAADPPSVASAPESTPAPDTSPPERLVVPSLDIEAPIVPIEMDAEGVLTPPGNVDTVGWWQRSAEPGARKGQILVTGHTVRVGEGAMDDIGQLRRGAEVRLHADGETTTYRTTKVFTYSRDQVAANAHQLFGQDRGKGGLVLVTCTDWNGETWESNVIVRAEPV